MWKNQQPRFLLNNYKISIFIALMGLPLVLNNVENLVEYALTDL
jgi:hypothetical protein